MRDSRYCLAAALLLWSSRAHGQLIDHSVGATPMVGLTRSIGQSSLYFIENQGQVAGSARYYLRGRDRTVFVRDDGLTVVLEPKARINGGLSTQSPGSTSAAFAVRLDFVGARPNASPRGEGTLGPVVSLLTGGRQSWRTGLPTYSRLTYKDLWPGIDLALVQDSQRIKYEFRVKAGADPAQIRLRYSGGESLRLEPSGDLAIDTPLGILRDQRPSSFQESNGHRNEVGTRYDLIAAGDGLFGFALASYDGTKALVIDPAVFVYASYLGGAGDDRGYAVAVDQSGAAYITGYTTSVETSFPTGTGFGSIPGADKTYNGGNDAFVAKVQPSGAGLEYVTYVGGTGDDVASGIAVDSSGCAYVVGYTNSRDFPVVGGPSTSYGGGVRDVFVLKLNASGTTLLYSGFIGGDDDDREPAIALDASGSVYVTGLTYSSEATFPTGTGFGSLPGADQTYNGGGDAFVVKVRPDGSGLVYASYIGGNNFDNGYAIGVDAAGNVYVGGNTASHEDTFPTGNGVGSIPGPNTTFAGGSFDAFVVKLNSAGTSFSYVAFVGGAGEDRYAPGLAVSPQGSAWITGRTVSAEDTFPTGHGFGSIPGFNRTYSGGWDAFVVKINAAGTAFDYATYIGGPGDDQAQAIAVDSDGNAYVTGWTNSTEATFPDGHGFGSVAGPDTTYNGGAHDVFVVKLNPAGTALGYATYIGGSGDELGVGIAVDRTGSAYITGWTGSEDGFPDGNGFGNLPGFDQTRDAGASAFIVKVSGAGSAPVIPVSAGDDSTVLVGTQVTLNGSTSAANCTSVYSWHFLSSTTTILNGANTANPSFTPEVEGQYTVELAISCGTGYGTATVHINVIHCMFQPLQVFPRAARLPTGSTVQTLSVQPAGAIYSWSWLQHQSGATLSPLVGQTVNYTPGLSPGQDIVHVDSSVCGQADIPITVYATKPPEATVIVTPNPTRGATQVTVTARFDPPADAGARVCVPDGGPQCWDMTPSTSPEFTATIPIGSLTPGTHALSVQGENGGGWGQATTTDLHVAQVAILLLNGYNFYDTGPHASQWWLPIQNDGGKPIACQIRDYFFGGSNRCVTDGTVPDCALDGPGHAKSVCVVDDLDGRGDIRCNVHYLEEYLDGPSKLSPACELDSNGINYLKQTPLLGPRPWLQDDSVQLILIGHSYGGQIARAYAAKHPGKVLSIITLDTPHFGVGLVFSTFAAVKEALCAITNGDACTIFSPYDNAVQYYWPGGAVDLNELLLRETTGESAKTPVHGVASQGKDVYRSVGMGLSADKGPIGSPIVTIGPNGTDNVIGIGSQQGLCTDILGLCLPGSAPVSSSRYVATIGNPRDFNFPAHILHNAILEESAAWNTLFDTIKPILSSYGAVGEAPIRRAAQTSVATPVALPALYTARKVLTVSGQFGEGSPGETAQFHVVTSSELTVNLLTDNANPTLALVAPSQVVINPATVDGLTSFYTSNRDALGTYQVFVVRNPAIGAWSVSAAVPTGGGTHLPATGSTWTMVVTERSPLALNLSLGDDKYLSGESINVVAKLDLSGVPVGGAAVFGNVISEDGTVSDTVSLYDDGQHGDGGPGDGVYGGSFTAGAAGSYKVSVTASGSSPIGSFNRQTDAAFSVGTAGSAISGPFVEAAADADGDGRYDSLGWSFTATVPGAGNYTCVGDLLAADGSLVTQGITSVSAGAAGHFPIVLSFSGLDIYRKAKLGPYTLANIRITLSTPKGERLSGRPVDTVVSGGPYWSWMSFQRDSVPAFTWIGPVGESIVTANSVTLQWSVFDGNGATSLDLYYDNSGSGFGGTPIVTGLPASQGAMSYSWDMSGLPDGVYYVYARVRNGEFSSALYSGGIRKLLDTDGDGMPDAWEIAHGLNPNDPSDAYLDPDGDGLSNVDEYLNGTDPHAGDTDGGGESDLSEAINGRDGLNPSDDVTGITLRAVSPAEGDSRGGEQVLVLGSGFQPGATVNFDDQPAPGVAFVNSTRLVVTTPAHSIGASTIVVANSSSGGSAMVPNAFTFLCSFVEPPIATNSGPLCPGQTLQLHASGLSGATFSWTGPNGFTSSLQSPAISQAGMAASGIYTVTMQVGGCSLQATTAAMVSAPSAPTATNSGPVCAGQDLQLSVSPVSNATYQWTGPGGFSSSSANPLLAAAQPAASGSYSVTATVNGCTSQPATTDVFVRSIPTATVTGSTQSCSGATHAIQAALTGAPPWTVVWSDSLTQSGIVSSPLTRTVQPTSTTTYSIASIGDAFCQGSSSGSAVITIGTPTAPTAANDGPGCTGQDLHLSASLVPGATYQWAGPGGFSSNQQNPVLTGAQLTASGTYSVTATANGCTSPPGTTQVVVLADPVATVTGGGPFCPGGSIPVKATLQGTSPWSLTWSDGFVQSGITTSSAVRNVSPATSTRYSVSTLSDAHCPGTATGSATADPSCRGFFFAITPCRVLDTRNPTGPYGGPALTATSTRIFNLAGHCGVPVNARAVAANITVTGASQSGDVRVFAAGTPLPGTSVINFLSGQTRANNAIIGVSLDGSAGIATQCDIGVGSVQLIVDLTGYFE